MIGTVIRALGIFAISALLLGQGLLILWVGLGDWPVTVPGTLAVLTGAGLWGRIAVEGLLGQLQPAEGSEIVPNWAPLLTFAAAIGAFYLAGWFGELGHRSAWPWLVGLGRSAGWWPSSSPFTAGARRSKNDFAKVRLGPIADIRSPIDRPGLAELKMHFATVSNFLPAFSAALTPIV